MSDAMRRVLGVLHRQWWVVVLTMAVAASVPLLVSRDTYTQEPHFEGTARVSVENKTLNTYSRLPTVDELLTDVASPDFRASSAEELKVSTEDLATGVRVYSVKSPQNAVMVAYRSENASEALRVSDEMAQLIAQRAQVLGKDEITQLRRQIGIIDDAIEEMTGLVSVDDATVERWKRADVSRTVWQLKLEREKLTDELRKVRQAYTVRGTAGVSELPAIQRSATGIAGALMGGLAAGLAIAAVREALWRRRQRRQPAAE